MAATSDLLGELHELVATALLDRIKSGEATAAEFAQAIKLLKDNNITAIPTTINTIPTASALVEGQSLAQANLTGGSASVAGTFMWKKTTMVPPVGENQEFDVIFTPDSKNYATATCKVTVTVTAKP